tara:strand:+ start:370 stop:645 length:276 start_codon:yes stop_codon:yes gene_type:complete
MKTNLGPFQTRGCRETTGTQPGFAVGSIEESLPSGTDPFADLRRIETALRRMDQGRYGRCIFCGDTISLKRLDEDPAVDGCSDCDEDQEPA